MRSHIYNSPIDVFAVGAIMAEMYRNYPLFPGSSELDQINKICAVMGTPTREEWPDGYKLAQQIGFHYPKYQKSNLKLMMPQACDDAIDLMNKMLAYNPMHRPSASTALQHPFFQCYIPIPVSLPEQKVFDKDSGKTELPQKIIENEITQNKQEEKKQNKILIKSGFYMRGSRYQPGINSIKMFKE